MSSHEQKTPSQRLGDLCRSESISVEAIRAIVDSMPSPHDALHDCVALHRACANHNVSLEIIQCLLEILPQASHCAAGVGNAERTSYPLHLACHNRSCPNDVIELLVKANPFALRAWDPFPWGRGEGLPLHLYLSRAAREDLTTVKMLAEQYPDALTRADVVTCRTVHGEYLRAGVTPLVTLLRRSDFDASLGDIALFLIHSNPESARLGVGEEKYPLYIACGTEGIDPRIVKALIEAWPEAASRRTTWGKYPIYKWCENLGPNHSGLDDAAAVEVLDMLLDAGTPDSLRDNQNELGLLPLHLAVSWGKHSPAFCKRLVDAYPESLKIQTRQGGQLPIHEVCADGRADTMKHLVEIDPQCIYARDSSGNLPIHSAARGRDHGGEHQPSMIRFLLMKDPAFASMPGHRGRLPLHIASVNFSLDAISILFDAYPEAIHAKDEDGKTPLDWLVQRMLAQDLQHLVPQQQHQRRSELVNFFDTQMLYARQAQNVNEVTTVDGIGWLPLHHALRDNASLGAVKLLLKANPSATRVGDDLGALPLHLASMYGSVEVVQFLANHDNGLLLNRCDDSMNFPIHHACVGGNCAVVQFLLGRCASSASKANVKPKLPIHLLCESDRVDWERPESIETVWLLLRADPETVLRSFV